MEFSEEEQKVWAAVQQNIANGKEPEGYASDPNPNLNQEERNPAIEENGWVEGSYWLPIFVNLLVGALEGAAGKGAPFWRKGGQGGRKCFAKTKGMRPKGGKAGNCHLCGEPGHWINECPNRGKGKGPQQGGGG